MTIIIDKCVGLRFRLPEVASPGMIECLLSFGDSKAAVYREIYKQLKKHGVGGKASTFIYPPWLKEVVRERFGGPVSGYDAQYEGKAGVYEVSNADLALLKFQK